MKHLRKKIFISLTVLTISTSVFAETSCVVSQIENGMRLEDKSFPESLEHKPMHNINLGKFVARVWLYVGLVGISIQDEHGNTLSQSRTAEENFTFAELWHHQDSKNVVWINCQKLNSKEE